MKRREFLASLAGAASAPFGAAAQQRKLPRIGVLWPGASADAEHIRLEALREGLKAVGLVHGETIVLENRFAKQQPDEFRRHSEEFASLNVAVLVAITQPAALAAQRATKTLPIVFLLAPDPVGTGLVDNLAMPGGNITGLSTMAVEYIGKRLEILKEAIPTLESVGILLNVQDAETAMRYSAAARAGGEVLGVTVIPLEVRSGPDLNDAISRSLRERVQGIMTTQDGLFFAERRRIAGLALAHRIPVVAATRDLVESGVLMAYGPNLPAIIRRGGLLISKILSGSRPRDLPVEQPTKFELFVNQTTAHIIGVEVPPTLLARADEVIE